MGVVILQNINLLNGNGEIVFVLEKENERKNDCLIEAGSLLINHGFENLNLNRIDFKVNSDNVEMINIVESLGFVKEAVRKDAVIRNGKTIDILEFGLLRAEWKQLTNNESN